MEKTYAKRFAENYGPVCTVMWYLPVRDIFCLQQCNKKMYSDFVPRLRPSWSFTKLIQNRKMKIYLRECLDQKNVNPRDKDVILAYKWTIPRSVPVSYVMRIEDDDDKKLLWKGLYDPNNSKNCLAVSVGTNIAII